MKSEFLDVNGQQFHALTVGNPDNPPMIFLHGFPEYSGAWTEIMELLKEEWFCIAPDQRGYGQSWRPDAIENYHMKHLVSDTTALINHFGHGDPVVLVGHDWGASVAYATAMTLPNNVSHLIILNGVHPVPFQKALANGGAQTDASQYINWLIAERSEELLAKNKFKLLASLFAEGMDMSWMTPERLAKYSLAWRDVAGVKAMVNWYRATPLVVPKSGTSISEDQLPNWDRSQLSVSMPHLLLWGLGDTALLPETKEGLEAFCEQLKVVEFPDADHWILHQKPEQVSVEIRNFLKEFG